MKITANENSTLIEVLVNRDKDLSKSRIRKWLKEGRLTVNEVTLDRDGPINKGDVICLDAKKQSVKGLPPLVFQDEYFIVVDKPTNLLTVDTEKKASPSVHMALKRSFGKVWPAHRLDRETSGVVLFTKSREAKDAIVPAFKARSIKREYVAILEGHLENDKGTWKCHLKEMADMSMRPCKDGELAITHYTVIKRSRQFTYVRLNLETGKKHQIRVHASLAGHPIVGDKRYGSEQDPFGRMALHAEKLTFVHPFTEKKVHFKSPNPFV